MPTEKSKRPRVSLSKLQIQEGAGAELLALCQTITEDGTLSGEEVRALMDWLNHNATTDIPAAAFLFDLVKRIAADKRITLEEQRELYLAVESVLPLEARKPAVAKRKALETAEREKEREVRRAAIAEEKARKAAERERERPVEKANFVVAGTKYEGRPQVIERYASEGNRVRLLRDRRNKYSRNAIEIRLDNGLQIGYVPEIDAEYLAPFFDSDHVYVAYIPKILTGRYWPIPVVNVVVYRADSDAYGAVSTSSMPPGRG